MADSKATEAAVRKAEELNVDLDQVEGTGADGQVKASDVEAFAAANGDASDTNDAAPPSEEQQSEEQQSEDKIVTVVVPGADFADGPDGVRYSDGDEVRESYFDAVLAGVEDRDEREMFEKGADA